jgi:ABC-2 type transport system ATP-binding protein
MIINKGKIVAEDTPERLQSRLTGAQRVVVQVAGDDSGLAGAIRAVPGVQDVNHIQDGRYEFETQPGLDVRAEVARSVVQAGYDLLDFHSMALSLEDIFMELTRDEPEPPSVSQESDDESVQDAFGE